MCDECASGIRSVAQLFPGFRSFRRTDFISGRRRGREEGIRRASLSGDVDKKNLKEKKVEK